MRAASRRVSKIRGRYRTFYSCALCWHAQLRQRARLWSLHGTLLRGNFLQQLPRDLYISGREANTLSRHIFLGAYAVINIALFAYAYSRHDASPKGRALRGERYLGCPAGDGFAPCPYSGHELGVEQEPSPLLLNRGTGK